MDHRMKPGANADSHASFFRHNARYFFALVFCLLALQDVFGTHGLMAMHRSKTQIEAIQTKLAKLDQENLDLQEHIQNLKTDPATIEKIARDRMGLARPGEMIFRLPAKVKPRSNAAARP